MIVFSSFIRAIYDRDNLPAWIAHYKAFGFDRYTAFLHDVSGEEEFTEATRADLLKAGFEVGMIRGDYNDGAAVKRSE